MNNDPGLALTLLAAVLLFATLYLVSRDRVLARDFAAFLSLRKRWWLGPVVVMLLLLGSLAAFTRGSRVAPFIYTLLK